MIDKRIAGGDTHIITGGTGITAGGNVTLDNISGQVAVGENITQTLSAPDKKELLDSLLEFQKEAAKLGLPAEEMSIVNGDITAAIKEAKKDKPNFSKIKDTFESAINAVKESGTTIKDISELYEPAKKIAKLVGIALSFLL